MYVLKRCSLFRYLLILHGKQKMTLKNRNDVNNYTRYGSLLARKSIVLRVTSNQSLIENTALEENGFSLFQLGFSFSNYGTITLSVFR